MGHPLLTGLIILAVILLLRDHTPIGNLPGDIQLQLGRLTLYCPFTSMILILLVVSFLKGLFR